MPHFVCVCKWFISKFTFLSIQEQDLKLSELESENRKMKVELEEFRTEATHLKNQQATIRRLEERNRQLEQQVSNFCSNYSCTTNIFLFRSFYNFFFCLWATTILFSGFFNSHFDSAYLILLSSVVIGANTTKFVLQNICKDNWDIFLITHSKLLIMIWSVQ